MGQQKAVLCFRQGKEHEQRVNAKTPNQKDRHMLNAGIMLIVCLYIAYGTGRNLSRKDPGGIAVFVGSIICSLLLVAYMFW